MVIKGDVGTTHYLREVIPQVNTHDKHKIAYILIHNQIFCIYSLTCKFDEKLYSEMRKRESDLKDDDYWQHKRLLDIEIGGESMDIRAL